MCSSTTDSILPRTQYLHEKTNSLLKSVVVVVVSYLYVDELRVLPPANCRGVYPAVRRQAADSLNSCVKLAGTIHDRAREVEQKDLQRDAILSW